MARPGRFEHYKPEVLLKFFQGLKPNEVCKDYPEIPVGTIYNWFDNWVKSGSLRPSEPSEPPIPKTPQPERRLTLVNSERSESNYRPPKEARSRSVSVRNPPDEDLTQWSDESDLTWLKRVLKLHIMAPKGGSATVIQGCNAMIRIVEIENNLPQSKWDKDADFDATAIETMEAAELGRGYADAVRQPDQIAG